MSNLEYKFLQIIKGVDVVGRTHYLRALALPEHLLPSSLKRTAEGIQVSDECEGRLLVSMQSVKSKSDSVETMEISNKSLSENTSLNINSK